MFLIVVGVVFGLFIILGIIGSLVNPSGSQSSRSVSQSNALVATATATSAQPPVDGSSASQSNAPVATDMGAQAAAAPVATPSPEPKAMPTPIPTTTPTPFKNRVVKLDLEGEKPDKYDQVAMAVIKKMKWSLSGDPITAAKEDAQQFLSVASGMKSYPSLEVKNLVMGSGADSFDNSLEIEKQLKASGMAEDKIKELSVSQEPDSPFAKNGFHVYLETVDEIIPGDFETYWARVLGKRPVSDVGLFSGESGISESNDIITKSLNDPGSFKFDHLVANPDPSGQAWKVDYYFRAKNAFGALMLDHYYFYMRDGKVVRAEHPKN